ncbi:hypothetical protein HID58_050218 [Brassica napus]|uniref:Peroxidase n=1 Tax=Brassica napus TaxID=3708 RepID=A0ABQ8A5H9_BRANA|nr:hypothetical protein HID58_050218 [Brassica napus]
MDSRGSSKDLISSLPNELICHIFSFLSTTQAASTSVLSKRWRHLLAFVTSLDFDSSIYDHPEGECDCQRCVDLLKSFIVFVDKVSERGVVDLDLYTSCEFNIHGYQLPPQVLVSKSLVRLILVASREHSNLAIIKSSEEAEDTEVGGGGGGGICWCMDELKKQTDLITYLVETMPNLEQVVLYYNSPIDDYLIGSAQRWFDHLLTPFGFDNSYFRNLMSQRDLLHSDQELFNGGSTVSIVREYSQNARVFRNDFAAAMVKMSHISPLTGTAGEIRRNCGRTN